MFQNPAPAGFSFGVASHAVIPVSCPIVTGNGTLAAGQSLPEGAVLGKITASGKFVLSVAAAADGSETPVGILADAVDASADDVSGITWYKSGQFLASNLTFGDGHTADSARDGLRDLNIYI